ncbi:MAG TPA: DUF6252 family protein [Bacteroidia bacterium]|nr:hypothetical protein [Bacteroidota bacterium]MBK7431888.1 hypothetical protein [Bacteroidota bacterium]MBK8587262.1 hypothetical protein [Bacteroidota bacterium]HQW23752.1 DUF6252 family protein [Bacteroidia bacterium]
MKSKLFSLALLILIIAGCKKEDETSTPIAPVGCSSILPNKLSVKVDGQSWCADQTCFGDLAIVMTINGINSNGSTLTLELDDFTPGTYPINQDQNHILYTSSLAMAYESTNSNAGTLVITSNDTTSNLIKGTINSTLHNPLGGDVALTEGTFSIYYTE